MSCVTNPGLWETCGVEFAYSCNWVSAGVSSVLIRLKSKPSHTMKTSMIRNSVASLVLVAGISCPAFGVQYTLSIAGSDAIFLAGRTDLTIPLASDPWTGPGDYLIRHGDPTPEEIRETLPPSIAVSGGDVIRVADPAVGGISFFNGLGGTVFGPSGNGLDGSNLSPLGGISGYKGPQGALVGVFLDASIPVSSPPVTLDFGPTGLGRDFTSLSPLLGQVFYIGDGLTSANVFQDFIAPSGATRLALGIPDGFSFVGAPGAYDDNDGAYRVRIGVNETPTGTVPDGGSSLWLLALGLIGLAAGGHRLQLQRVVAKL